eukprot:907844_1
MIFSAILSGSVPWLMVRRFIVMVTVLYHHMKSIYMKMSNWMYQIGCTKSHSHTASHLHSISPTLQTTHSMPPEKRPQFEYSRRTSLLIQSLKLCELREITFEADERMLNLKNKHLSYVFHGCFAVLRKLFRSVLCIYYPPPWLAAVAVFKSLRAYNKKRLTSDKEKKAGPKLYLKYEWFKLFDPTKRLNLNTIQYISDEIDACDDAVISVRDYTSIPYEICGVKTWTLAKRISLIRTTPFDQLAVEMQDDLRDAFKLRKTECIDLRCEKIRAIEAQNDALKLQQENTNNAVDIDWIGGAGPTHAQTIAALMKEPRGQVSQSSSSLMIITDDCAHSHTQ